MHTGRSHEVLYVAKGKFHFWTIFRQRNNQINLACLVLWKHQANPLFERTFPNHWYLISYQYKAFILEDVIMMRKRKEISRIVHSIIRKLLKTVKYYIKFYTRTEKLLLIIFIKSISKQGGKTLDSFIVNNTVMP